MCPYTAVKILSTTCYVNGTCTGDGQIMETVAKDKHFFINPYPTAFPYGNGMVLHFYPTMLPAEGRQHRGGCITPQAVTHSLVLLKMGKIISRNMLS